MSPWFAFEKKMALIALPVSFTLLQASRFPLPKKLMIQVFGVTTTVMSLAVILVLLLKGIAPDYSTPNSISYGIRMTIESISGLHPTYYSVMCALTIFIWLQQLESEPSTFARWASIASIIILLVILILLSSRAPLIGFMITTLWWVFGRKIKSSIQVKGLTIALMLIAIAIGFPTLSERFMELYSGMNSPFGYDNNTVSLRVAIYTCSIELIKQHWLMGIGTGVIQEALNQCYVIYHTPELLQRMYNTPQ